MSEIRKELGKIESCKFGLGGYDDVMFGLTLVFETGGTSVSHFIGSWDWNEIKRSDDTRWTEEDRDAEIVKACKTISYILHAKKSTNINDIVGTPVEVTYDGIIFKSFRILTEVL